MTTANLLVLARFRRVGAGAPRFTYSVHGPFDRIQAPRVAETLRRVGWLCVVVPVGQVFETLHDGANPGGDREAGTGDLEPTRRGR